MILLNRIAIVLKVKIIICAGIFLGIAASDLGYNARYPTIALVAGNHVDLTSCKIYKNKKDPLLTIWTCDEENSDSAAYAAVLNALNGLNENPKVLAFNELENFCESRHNIDLWRVERFGPQLPPQKEGVPEFEWPFFDSNVPYTYVFLKSNIELHKCSDIALQYIGIARKIFAEDPQICMMDIACIVKSVKVVNDIPKSLTSVNRHEKGRGKKRFSIEQRRKQQNMEQQHVKQRRLFMTDGVWRDVVQCFPKSDSDKWGAEINKRDFLEALCRIRSNELIQEEITKMVGPLVWKKNYLEDRFTRWKYSGVFDITELNIILNTCIRRVQALFKI